MYTDAIGKFLGEWAMTLNPLSILFRSLLSIIFAALIGYERSYKRHSAGIRTFIIISFASTVAMMVDLCLMAGGSEKYAFLSGAAVLASAMISVKSIFISSRNQIKGLTTSAALWLMCMIGFAFGAGFYVIGIFSFIGTLAVLNLLPAVERFLADTSNHFDIHLELTSRSALKDFVTVARKLGLQIDDIEANPAYLNTGLTVYSIAFKIESDELKKYRKHSEIIDALKTLDYVNHIEEMI